MPSGCRKCPLSRSRTHIVVDRKSGKRPVILFVGEAPGAEEDKLSKPFVGASGKLLDAWLTMMDLDVDYAITNTVRCRPPDNRRPTPLEMNTCGEHLLYYISMMKPKVIVALGRTADTYLSDRGIQHIFQYHPAYYLYRGGGWEDDIETLERKIRAGLRDTTPRQSSPRRETSWK